MSCGKRARDRCVGARFGATIGAVRVGVVVLALGFPLFACGAEPAIEESRSSDPVSPEAPRPNIIVLFADDLGYGDLGVAGHPTIETPNLDRLASEGQRFTDFYVASPVCSPSRGALLTGRLPVRTGLYGRRIGVYFPDDPGGLPASEITMAELLRDAGYRTGMVGKWHLGDRPEAWPTRHGFESWLGIPYSNDMDWEVGYSFPESLAAAAQGRSEDQLADRAKKRAAYFAPEVAYWNVPLYSSVVTASGFEDSTLERPAFQPTVTKRYTERAIELMTGWAEDESPFFLYLAYSMPHVPLFRSPEFEGHSRAGLYGDVIEEIDWSVGQIEAALVDLGLANDTLVVFTSDNGPWLTLDHHGGSAGHLKNGKGTTFEGGVRVPGLFHWPGRVAPRVVHDVGSTLDLFVTFARLAGAELPEDRTFDGHDLAPVLLGQGPGTRDEMPFYRSGELYAFRKGRYKIHFVTEGSYGAPPVREVHDPPVLHDLWVDPSERFDLSLDLPEVGEDVRAAALAHRASFEPAPPEMDRRLGD